MISRYKVWLNDVSIADINPLIYVNDIQYSLAFDRSTVAKGIKYGSFYRDRTLASSNIKVEIEIDEYNTAIRQQICQDVARWALAGGWLTTSDRLNQRIYVVCDEPPVISSALKWTEKLTITFTAYGLPLWQSTMPSTVSFYGTNESGTIINAGNMDSFVTVEAMAGGSTSQVTFVAGNTHITLDGISAEIGDIIAIGYTDDRADRKSVV